MELIDHQSAALNREHCERNRRAVSACRVGQIEADHVAIRIPLSCEVEVEIPDTLHTGDGCHRRIRAADGDTACRRRAKLRAQPVAWLVERVDTRAGGAGDDREVQIFIEQKDGVALVDLAARDHWREELQSGANLADRSTDDLSGVK